MQTVLKWPLLAMASTYLLMGSPGGSGRVVASSDDMITGPAVARPVIINAVSVPSNDDSPQAFEAHLAQEASALQGTQQSPDALQAELLQKLQAGEFVTDKGISEVLIAWFRSESPGLNIPGKRGADGHLCPGTRNFVALVLPYAYGRPDLQVLLHQGLGQIAYLDKDYVTAAAENGEAESVGASAYTDNWLLYNTICTEHGDALCNLGKVSDAESAYDNVLSDESFNAFKDSDWRTKQREIYLEAGKGLIHARQSDLGSLQHTFFVPFASGTLNPVRDQAIQKAGGNPDSMPKPSDIPVAVEMETSPPAGFYYYVVPLPADTTTTDAASGASPDPVSKSAGHLSDAQTFEAELLTKTSKLEAAGSNPSDLQKVFTAKLKSGKFVTTKGIMAVVQAWKAYESQGQKNAGKQITKGSACPGTRSCIELILPYSYGRSDLAAMLHESLGEIAEASSDYSLAESEYKQAEDIQTPTYLSDWLRYDAICTRRGDIFIGLGKVPEAYVEYANVLPDDSFFLTTDNKQVQQQSGVYLNAAQGFLRCEEYDLPRLEHTFFSAFIKKTVDPSRDEAIKRAGGPPVTSPFPRGEISRPIVPIGPGPYPK